MISALTIAGFDPGGGAGLQADLRLFAAAGLAGWSVATAITIQNTSGVRSVALIDPAVVAEQLDAVFSDARDLRAVKIGMLGGAEQVRAVADALRRWTPKNVILDPVLTSTAGVPLLDENGIVALREELIPLCDLVTPNLDEAARIGTSGRAVLVKGGHAVGDPMDVLYRNGNRVRDFRAPRVATSHSHGTGCALSSAIAAEMALGAPLEEAIARAKGLVTRALRSPVIAGRGRGYPDVRTAAKHQERINRIRGIYVLTDSRLRADRSHEDIARAALEGGASVIQLREKSLPTADVIAVARRLRALTQTAGALFIVNDRADIAVAANADGVHIGPEDLAPADARRIVGDDRIVGVSVSTVEEAAAAVPYATYLSVGAIYGSTTKHDAGDAVGVERVAAIRAAFPTIPIVAIGGITPENLAAVAHVGADAAAVVSAVICSDDMKATTRLLVQTWASYGVTSGKST